MRPTIKDVASLAGVSTATVSHVITQKKHVSPELEQRIRDAMSELGYQPNSIARSLKMNRSKIIGVTVPSISNPFFAEIIEQIQKHASVYGYSIMLYSSDNDPKAEKKNLTSFLSARVDGVIDVAPRLPEEVLEQHYSVPLVIADRPPFDTEGNTGFVFADNYHGAVQVADFLAGQGYQYFVCFAGPVHTVPNARMRLEGFLGRLEELGFGEDRCRIYYCEYSFDSGYQTMQQLLREGVPAGLRTAIFAPSDIMAWGAMEAIKSAGLKIPRDYGLVGFDNIIYSNYLYPALTTVENPTRELGEEAIRLLLDSIEHGKVLSGHKIALEANLIVRSST